jgi:hypothetical protein
MRDAEDVPLICPTCQNVFCGQSIDASDLFLFKGFLSLHGVVFDIFVCRAVVRGPRLRRFGSCAAAFTRFASEGWLEALNREA